MHLYRLLLGSCISVCLMAAGFCANEWRHNLPPTVKHEHPVDNILVYCSDHRFRPITNYWIKTQLDDDADELKWPGGVKLLNSSDETTVDDTIKAIALLAKGHKAKTIHLLNHLDCSAYGGSSRHVNETAERKFHEKELRQAAGTVAKHLPDIKVRIYLEDFHGIAELSL